MNKLKHTLVSLVLLTATAVPAMARPSSAVQDNARVLSSDTVAQIQKIDDEIYRNTGKDLLVVTESSLSGSPSDQAREIFQREKLNGMLIFVVPPQKKLGLVPGRSTAEIFPSSRLGEIRQAMLPDFRRNDFDAGVLTGARQIQSTFQGSALAKAPPGPLQRRQTSSGWGSWIYWGLGLGLAFLALRWIGGMMSSRPSNYGVPSGGYQNPGAPMGGGGGGFLGNLAAGVGGALLGNTIYDAFTGRHNQSYPTSSSSDTHSGWQSSDNGAIGGGDYSDFGGSDSSAGDWGGDGGGDWG